MKTIIPNGRSSIKIICRLKPPFSSQDVLDYYDYEDDYYEEGEQKGAKGKKRFEVILGSAEDAPQSGGGNRADAASSSSYVKDRQRRKKIRQALVDVVLSLTKFSWQLTMSR